MCKPNYSWWWCVILKPLFIVLVVLSDLLELISLLKSRRAVDFAILFYLSFLLIPFPRTWGILFIFYRLLSFYPSYSMYLSVSMSFFLYLSSLYSLFTKVVCSIESISLVELSSLCFIVVKTWLFRLFLFSHLFFVLS